MGQFTFYSSSDAGGPGAITGQVGSLITVLDACLVDGYAGHAAAGWSHPVATAGNIASYQQGAGCGFACVINDNGPNVTSTFKEAWITGWESVASVAAPVGTGTGQFPLPAQLLVTGHAVIRKSASADAVARAWNLYADASTFILLIYNGDNAAYVHGVYFGDVYSLAADAYRCLLIAKSSENSSITNNDNFGAAGFANAAVVGHFLARAFGGGGGSITASKHGDAGKTSNSGSLGGIIQTPNAADNCYYMSPVWVSESTPATILGRLRGVFQICHAVAGFGDGQTIDGGGDFAGKTFRIHAGFPTGSSVTAALAFETSNTVETN